VISTMGTYFQDPITLSLRLCAPRLKELRLSICSLACCASWNAMAPQDLDVCQSVQSM
jgi:hypothetical protein